MLALSQKSLLQMRCDNVWWIGGFLPFSLNIFVLFVICTYAKNVYKLKYYSYTLDFRLWCPTLVFFFNLKLLRNIACETANRINNLVDSEKHTALFIIAKN